MLSGVQLLSLCSNSLQPHRLQHTRLPCPSLSPGVYSSSCALSRGCHPTISSAVIPVSSSLWSPAVLHVSKFSGPFLPFSLLDLATALESVTPSCLIDFLSSFARHHSLFSFHLLSYSHLPLLSYWFLIFSRLFSLAAQNLSFVVACAPGWSCSGSWLDTPPKSRHRWSSISNADSCVFSHLLDFSSRMFRIHTAVSIHLTYTLRFNILKQNSKSLETSSSCNITHLGWWQLE